MRSASAAAAIIGVSTSSDATSGCDSHAGTTTVASSPAPGGLRDLRIRPSGQTATSTPLMCPEETSSINQDPSEPSSSTDPDMPFPDDRGLSWAERISVSASHRYSTAGAAPAAGSTLTGIFTTRLLEYRQSRPTDRASKTRAPRGVPRHCGPTPLFRRAVNNTGRRADVPEGPHPPKPPPDYYFNPRRRRSADSRHPEAAVEHEQETAGISRGQNQLHVLPEDREAAESVVSPLLERADAASAVPQIVVVTNDADFAAAVAGRLAPVAAERDLRTLAVTDARRAARVQRSAPAHLVIGPAAALVALLQSAVLKLDGVRAIVLAWVDDVKHSETAALETLMSEIPKDAARVVVVNAVTTTVEQLVERYARRARRVQPAGPESLAPVALSYLAVSEAARIGALRRVLDAVDPESAFVVTRSADSRDAVEAVLRS